MTIEMNVWHLILMWAGLSLVAWAIKSLAALAISGGGVGASAGKAVLNVSI